MDNKRAIENGALAIRDGKITFVGKSSCASGVKAETYVDGRGKVALPGLINAHTHVPMTLFRGLAEDQPLEKWLKETIWPLEAKLKPDDVYAGALLGCLEMIKSGTTCFADMYFHENMVAKAVAESGLRGTLAEGIIETGKSGLGEEMFSRSVDFVKNFNGYAFGRVKAMLGPHAAYSCGKNLLLKVREKALELNVGVHLHLAESKAMLKETQNQSEVAFLDKLGFFDGHTLAAHCINLSRRDMQTLYRRGVNVVHVPVANMKLGLEAAKIKDLAGLGVNVCLGTDGPASNNTLDMFETMKFAALLQKHTYHDPAIFSAYEVLKMATINGAKALSLADAIGSLEVGKMADIILIDLNRPHLKPLHDIFSSVVYSARGGDVDTVIVDGKVLMKNRILETLDEAGVMKKAEKVASDILSR
ncbi:N-ethylammeline chlorohydrolase [Candidatus Bathyarchaeota archaeon]|nr:MAG: N-ethylammeline chlorohydrolase [Candidatus Bathyarchaeota archaeon]